VIYTTLGFRQFWLTDAALQRACFRVYNDWLAEYCAYAPKRLTGLALISLYDVVAGVKELRRCAGRGLKGALIWASPPEDRPYSSTDYDPFWAEAQALGIPISLHSITGMGAESRLAIRQPLDRYVRSAVLCHEVQRTLVVLIFSGVLERFPHLKLVSAENEVGWLPFFLQKLDQAQEEYRYLYPAPLKLTPSEYFRRQIFATFIDDAVGVATREFIGAENIMWSSDYPHTVSTWPHSRAVVERDFKNVPEKEKRLIVRENVVRLYSLDLP
jgi:predicted TIM-barrel fold metal-dependent hydrolase